MAKKRATLSFYVDNNLGAKVMLIGQAKFPTAFLNLKII